MFRYRLRQGTVDKFADKFGEDAQENIRKALQDITMEWGQEIFRQQRRRGRSNAANPWTPLDPYYAERKKEDYEEGRNGVKYRTILRRTGRMLDAYRDLIYADYSRNAVEIPYPTIYARYHQEGTYKMPARPFDVEPFRRIAIDKFTKAIRKTIDE